MASPYHLTLRSSTGASKCAKSNQELLVEKWRLANLHKTHRVPAPYWGQHPLKRAGPYLKPPWSSAGWSKCAKSCKEPLAEKWRLANLLETHRGLAPWWGQHPLKTAGPYLKPPWSSDAQSKYTKSHQELLAEKWKLADLLETHKEPAPW